MLDSESVPSGKVRNWLLFSIVYLLKQCTFCIMSQLVNISSKLTKKRSFFISCYY